MTRIYTRTSFERPWKLHMIVGSGIHTDPLIQEIKNTGLRVFVVHEQPQMVKKPKI